jgi:hypothetical protein
MTRKVVYLLKTFQMSCFHIQWYEWCMAALLEQLKFDIQNYGDVGTAHIESSAIQLQSSNHPLLSNSWVRQQ